VSPTSNARTEDFSEAVAAVLMRLEPGEVVSYGDVAEEAGFPGAARAVGNLVRTTPGLPWWRVVARSGRLTPGHEQRQAELLRSEGVRIVDGRVKMGMTPQKSPEDT
jgi:methylated-DNA-protein-cysteine methyltransferase-like protein